MKMIVALLLVAACGRGKEAAPAGTAPAGTTTTPTPDPARWVCQVDADCTSSCALGAVNAAWYATAKVDECEDGCADYTTKPPRCLEGSCVAFWQPPEAATPTRNERCTRKR